MADVKISELQASTLPLSGTEEVAIVQAGVTKKATVADFIPVTAVIADSVAADLPTLVADHNALLQALRDAGIVGV